MATVLEQREPDQSRWRGHRTTAGLALAVLLAAMVIFVAADFLQAAVPALSRWMPADEPSGDLRWLLALLPGSIIVNHVVYLVSSRRKQFREALGPMDENEIQRLENLYFGYGPLTVRYILPAVFVTVLSSTAIAALTAPHEYLPWLYVPTTAANKTMPGVSSLGSSNDVLTVGVDPERREDIESRLATMVGIRRKP